MQPDCDLDELTTWLHGLDRFTSWNGAATYRVTAIKTYRTPGNARHWSGAQAVWVQSERAKRPKVLMLVGVQAAIQYLAHPEWRGLAAKVSDQGLVSWFAHEHLLLGDLPNLYDLGGCYLGLARAALSDRTIDLDGDPATEARAREEMRRCGDPDDLSAWITAGYRRALRDADGTIAIDALPELALSMVWSRFARPMWSDSTTLRDDLLDDLRSTWTSIRADPEQQDLLEHDLAATACLVLNLMQWLGLLRSGWLCDLVVNALLDQPATASDNESDQDPHH